MLPALKAYTIITLSEAGILDRSLVLNFVFDRRTIESAIIINQLILALTFPARELPAAFSFSGCSDLAKYSDTYYFNKAINFCNLNFN